MNEPRREQNSADTPENAVIKEAIDRLDEVALRLDRLRDVRHSTRITTVAYETLRVVSKNEGLSVTDVVRATGKAQSTTSEILKRLAKQGLVEQKRSTQDGRVVNVKLKGIAVDLIEDVYSTRLSSWRTSLKRLEPSDRHAFAQALERVTETLRNPAE